MIQPIWIQTIIYRQYGLNMILPAIFMVVEPSRFARIGMLSIICIIYNIINIYIIMMWILSRTEQMMSHQNMELTQ